MLPDVTFAVMVFPVMIVVSEGSGIQTQCPAIVRGDFNIDSTSVLNHNITLLLV